MEGTASEDTVLPLTDLIPTHYVVQAEAGKGLN